MTFTFIWWRLRRMRASLRNNGLFWPAQLSEGKGDYSVRLRRAIGQKPSFLGIPGSSGQITSLRQRIALAAVDARKKRGHVTFKNSVTEIVG